MYNITLICTAHSEIGSCNSWELYKIIKEFKPEIIFEELSSNAYNRCYRIQNLFTLETSAIKLYLQNHFVEHVSVVGSEIAEEHTSMLDVMVKDYRYRSLLDNLMSLEGQYGFPFLNSSHCEQLFEKMNMLERMILMDADDEIPTRIYKEAHKAIDDYENEIIINVYNYSKGHLYDKALMFIGAAHRKSLIQKIQDYEKNNQLKLNWTFYLSPKLPL